ncbi:hypothetical protein RJG79_07175 [Mycoplasmatota bacterium WC44]
MNEFINSYLIRNLIPPEFDWATFYGIVISSAISLSVSIYLVQRSRKMTDDTIKANMRIASKIENNKYACHFNFEVTDTSNEDKLIDPENNIIVKYTLPNEFGIGDSDTSTNYYVRVVNESNNICKIRLEDVVIKSINTKVQLEKEVVNSRTFALLGNKDFIVIWFTGNFDFGTILDIMMMCSIEFSYINQLGNKVYVRSDTMNDNILKEYKDNTFDENDF